MTDLDEAISMCKSLQQACLDCAAALRAIPEKPSAALVESAIHMANTEVYRAAVNTGMSAQVIEIKDPARVVPMPGVDHGE